MGRTALQRAASPPSVPRGRKAKKPSSVATTHGVLAARTQHVLDNLYSHSERETETVCPPASWSSASTRATPRSGDGHPSAELWG